MIKKIATIITLSGTMYYVNAQESNPLVISGSIDTYYKYDFSGIKDADGISNIRTSFADEQNSISLGMIDIGIKKTVKKASFVAEVSFGPRGQYQSIPTGAKGSQFNIQNLSLSYAFTDKLSMTAGYMPTFVGYEVISPAGNFNYSTSYLFTNGPFQNAGIKANYVFSDKVSLMVGLFDDWNTYQDFNGVSHIGAQLTLNPIEGLTAYFNVLNGQSAGSSAGSGTILDLTTAYQISPKFKLGLNVADYTVPENGGYTGAALYPQYVFSDSFSLGIRGEYFKLKDIGIVTGASVTALTVSANVKAGPMVIIPEIRLDNASTNTWGFVDSKNLAVKQATQFLIKRSDGLLYIKNGFNLQKIIMVIFGLKVLLFLFVDTFPPKI